MAELKPCKMRHVNGNCLPVGGFCTAVPREICEAVKNAYEHGYADCLEKTRRAVPENKPLTNFQRITESPEKLAEVIAAIVHGHWAGATITDDPEKWLEWLNQPVNEEGPR